MDCQKVRPGTGRGSFTKNDRTPRGKSLDNSARAAKKQIVRAAVVSILLLAGLGAGVWWTMYEHDQRYDGKILTIARQYGLPPGLVKAVVWKESAFNARVRGKHDEIGLMQLQPTSAQEWADARHDTHFLPEHLLDAETNLHAGCFYLSKLVRRYPKTDNPWAYALADYNAGRGNVLRWMKGPAETNSAAFLDSMTFPTTRAYVQGILSRYPVYASKFP